MRDGCIYYVMGESEKNIEQAERTELMESIIVRYLQGDCSEDELVMLLGWIRETAANRDMFVKIKQLYDLRPKGGLYPSEEEVESCWQRLLAKQGKFSLNESLSTPQNAKPQGKLRRIVTSTLRYAAVGLTFAVMAVAAQYLFFNKEPDPVFNTIEVSPNSSLDRITLPDGSTVLLNSSTTFRFPDRFSSKVREVYIDGEGYFDIVRDEKKPFIIHANQQTINVLGTKFNVMDYSTDDYAITTLYSGRVKVLSSDIDGQAAKEETLKPNQQVYLDKATARLTVSNIKPEMDRMWLNKTYHFHGEPLQRIVKRLEKLYHVNFTITDEKLQNEPFTGTFRLTMTIGQVLDIMNSGKHFSYKMNGDSITLSPRKRK